MRFTKITKKEGHEEAGIIRGEGKARCLTIMISFVLLFFVLFLKVAPVFAAPPEPKFEAQTIDGAIQIGYGVDVGDVDGDGLPDILLADKKQFVWYRNPGKAGAEWPKFIMAENLTEHDNVCITARDIDGDGKVEVAVGGNWNPGETTDPSKSGAIFYLVRPQNPTQKWEAIQIKPHEPTVHRMRWVKAIEGIYRLVVLPLHGVANKDGEGEAVRLQVITPPKDPREQWKSLFIDTELHATHNLEPVWSGATTVEVVIVAGREGVLNTGPPDLELISPEYRGYFTLAKDHMKDFPHNTHPQFTGAGEVRFGRKEDSPLMIATIEPMHGRSVVAYVGLLDADTPDEIGRVVIDSALNQGHALACADLLSLRFDQIIAGWRQPNAEGNVGIRMYVPLDEKYEHWKTYTIDDNTMACEDLKVADMDGDGRLDIVASGRATKNVIVYWNRTELRK